MFGHFNTGHLFYRILNPSIECFCTLYDAFLHFYCSSWLNSCFIKSHMRKAVSFLAHPIRKHMIYNSWQWCLWLITWLRWWHYVSLLKNNHLFSINRTYFISINFILNIYLIHIIILLHFYGTFMLFFLLFVFVLGPHSAEYLDLLPASWLGIIPGGAQETICSVRLEFRSAASKASDLTTLPSLQLTCAFF